MRSLIKMPITIGTVPLYSTYRCVHFEDSNEFNHIGGFIEILWDFWAGVEMTKITKIAKLMKMTKITKITKIGRFLIFQTNTLFTTFNFII